MALMVTSLYAAKVTMGLLHDPVQAGVVTETEPLGAEEPAPSFASTLKLKVDCAVSPLTAKLVPVVVPMELPFFRIV